MRLAIPPELHPLVRKSLRALKPNPNASAYERSKDDGLLRTPKGLIRIAVASSDFERAGRVLDALIRLVEGPALGGTVELGDWSCIVLDGERFRFRLKQETTRTAHRPNPAEKREIERYPSFNYVPKWDWHHTDKLTLEFFDDDTYSYNPVARLRDGERRGRIEGQLPTLPNVLQSLVEQRKARRAENERWRLQYQEQLRLEEEARQRAEAEKRLVAELMDEAKRWRDACLLRDYAEALEGAARAAHLPDDSVEMTRARWARGIAADLSPVEPKAGDATGPNA